MTVVRRSSRRTSYPALMLFGFAYLATLAIVVSPASFRVDKATLEPTATNQTAKGTP